MIISESSGSKSEYTVLLKHAYINTFDSKTRIILIVSHSEIFRTDRYENLRLFISFDDQIPELANIATAKTFFVKTRFKETVCGFMSIENAEFKHASDGAYTFSGELKSKSAYAFNPDDDSTEPNETSISLSVKDMPLKATQSHEEFETYITDFSRKILNKFFLDEWKNTKTNK